MVDAPPHSDEPCLIQPRRDRGLEAYARRRMGAPNPSIGYFAAVPWIARATVDLHPEFGLLLELDMRTADLVGLVVSQENACRYCYAAVRASLWVQGMSRDRIDRVEQDLQRTDLAPHSRAAVGYARAQSRRGPAGALQAWPALRGAGVGAQAAREIAFTVAMNDFGNRLHSMPAIPALPFERMPERWAMRLLRPLMGRVMRGRRFRGRPTPAPDVAGLPCGRLIAAYAGSPIGPVLARTLREMFDSPHLSRRCKLLIFAVVARGLSCPLCEADLVDALRAAGLDGATVATALAHLDAPALEPVERALLPFVRETLWYQPAALQRRTRALRAQLGEEQLLEAIAVAAMANGLCRMAAAVLAEPG